jgi:hypothetical protein
MSILTHNLMLALKRMALPEEYATGAAQAAAIFDLQYAGRIVHHARRLVCGIMGRLAPMGGTDAAASHLTLRSYGKKQVNARSSARRALTRLRWPSGSSRNAFRWLVFFTGVTDGGLSQLHESSVTGGPDLSRSVASSGADGPDFFAVKSEEGSIEK